jgi:hypothetical protein
LLKNNIKIQSPSWKSAEKEGMREEKDWKKLPTLHCPGRKKRECYTAGLAKTLMHSL